MPSLLAEADQHQQGVVHRQAEPQHRRDLDRVHGDVRELAEAEQREERARDPGHRHQQRQPGRTQPPEHHEQQDQHDRKRDQLGLLHVLLGALAELLAQQRSAADVDPGHLVPPDPVQPVGRVVHRRLLGVVVEAAVQDDGDDQGPSVLGDQPGCGVGVGHLGDARDLPQVGHGPPHLGAHGGVRDGGGLDHAGDRVARRVQAVQVFGGDLRLGARDVGHVVGELPEDARAEAEAEQQEQAPQEEHGQRAAGRRPGECGQHGPSRRSDSGLAPSPPGSGPPGVRRIA
ncbi:hypothetical protein RKD29_006346 [Streptomyces tendae]